MNTLVTPEPQQDSSKPETGDVYYDAGVQLEHLGSLDLTETHKMMTDDAKKLRLYLMYEGRRYVYQLTDVQEEEA